VHAIADRQQGVDPSAKGDLVGRGTLEGAVEGRERLGRLVKAGQDEAGAIRAASPYASSASSRRPRWEAT
jgi:hypothetical protein